jgi:HNH endonuclease/AP2 domain
MSILSLNDVDGACFIPLSKGKVATVDACHFKFLSQWKWCYWENGSKTGGYAARIDLSTGKRIKISMHRLVCKISIGDSFRDDLDVDHINQNKLDNRASNLRLASRHQNSGNRGGSKLNKSGYKGVSLYDSGRMAWRAQIMDNGEKRGIGYFATAEEAALAYNEEAIKVFGEYAHLNVVQGVTKFTKLIYKTSTEYKEKGVSFHKGSCKWVAYAKVSGRRVHIGYYKTEQEAIDARSIFIENGYKKSA